MKIFRYLINLKTGVMPVSYAGATVLYLGIAFFWFGAINPKAAEIVSNIILHHLGLTPPQLAPEVASVCAVLGVPVAVTSARYVNGFFWLVGAVLLSIQPYIEAQTVKKLWAFFIFELSMIAAAILPLVEMSAVAAGILRAIFIVWVIFWMGAIEGRSMLPAVFNWVGAWKGKYGELAFAMVAAEILSTAYTVLGYNAIWGWVMLTVGSVAMGAYGYQAFKEGVPIGRMFGWMNLVFVVNGVCVLGWLLLVVR